MNKDISTLIERCPKIIRENIYHKTYKPGEFILHQGDEVKTLYIITKGHVEVFHSSIKGSNYLMKVFSPGEVFGDVEILDKRPCLCNIKALKSVTTLCVPRDAYKLWLKEDYDFAMFINQELCNKIYFSSQKSSEDILYSLKYRLISYLEYQFYEHESSTISLNKQQISETLGSTLRSINRIIDNLEKKGLLRYEKGKVNILSLEKLKSELDNSL